VLVIQINVNLYNMHGERLKIKICYGNVPGCMDQMIIRLPVFRYINFSEENS